MKRGVRKREGRHRRTFAEDEVEGEVDELVRRGGERDDRADRAEAASPYPLAIPAAQVGPNRRAPRQESGVDAVCHEHAY